MKLLSLPQKLFIVINLLLLPLFLTSPIYAITANGTWKAYDPTIKKYQTGQVRLTFPAKGGSVSGTFSGSLGSLFTYGGRINGNFTGGWNGSFSGGFSGWYQIAGMMGQPPQNGNIQGPFRGSISQSGKVTANFTNTAQYGLSGDVTLYFSVDEFNKELGQSPSSAPSQSVSPSPASSPTPSISITPTITPTPTPEPKEITLYNLDGKIITNAKVRIKLKNGDVEEYEITDGKISFDKTQVKSIVVENQDGKRISLNHQGLDKPQVIIAQKDQWKQHIKDRLTELAQILNGGEEVNLDDYFDIDWESDDNAYQPPWFDFMRKLGFKDKINFNGDYISINSDVDTPIHEALGHALTEVLGKNNEFEHAGKGTHVDPWQPGYIKRAKYNPVSWFKGTSDPLSDEEARGLAMSEGWAQYVGDKWDRDLTGTADSDSEFTTANAQEKMEQGKNGGSGKLYDHDQGYGAKVENVVATVFNELYQGQELEDAVSDFQTVREAYKAAHDGETFQNINQYLTQKKSMTDDQAEKARIDQLINDLQLE
ncbi:MAG: hypothetical protein GF390_03420 [Candidatus Pacebacteria bacterium]|nr:hypothetical protein [Candidatus Paceibacterota bacterium]